MNNVLKPLLPLKDTKVGISFMIFSHKYYHSFCPYEFSPQSPSPHDSKYHPLPTSKFPRVSTLKITSHTPHTRIPAPQLITSHRP